MMNDEWQNETVFLYKTAWTETTAYYLIIIQMKKALKGDANTARNQFFFCRTADPFPGAQDSQNLIS